MRVRKNLLLREIAGEYLLIPVGEAALHIHGMINLTESGHLLWQKLQEDTTEEELVQIILSEYDVNQGTAENDVKEFIAKMDQIGILDR